MKFRISIIIIVAVFSFGINAFAIDPPHSLVLEQNCSNCHQPHHAPGGTITKVQGNENLCISCHTPGSHAANRPFSPSDQALPGIIGTSHRFDSGEAGHVKASLSNTSTGNIDPGGVFNGRIEKTYNITIATSGSSLTALFDWSDNEGNSDTGLTAGVDIPLNNGLVITFEEGNSSPSFIAGDTWTLYVRTDLTIPDPTVLTTLDFEFPIAQRTEDGKVMCSSCHNQHSQEKTPEDPDAPAYPTDGTGWTTTGVGRHYQRVDNDMNQMCHVCHSVRNVTTSADGSHPVGVPVPGAGFFQNPASLQLVGGVGGNVNCTTCHSPHYTDSGGANAGQGDGYLLDDSIGNLCYQCHTIGDSANASHLNTSTGVLWPGGQYGSSFPAHTTDKQGFCINCHWPHGWPDNDNMSQDYPRLWVERYDVADDGTDPADAEDLCFTCHDGTPASTNIMGEFAKGANDANNTFHHPVNDSEQTAGRSVECVDCHNPHQATSANKHKGVDGIDLSGSVVDPTVEDAFEYEICFKCHGDTYNASRPRTSNKRLDFQTTNSAFHPVAAVGRNQSVNLNAQLRGGLTTNSTLNCTDCHNSEATSDTFGLASNSPSSPKGPHGSDTSNTNANYTNRILRANYWTNLTGPTNWDENNFSMCFLCHDPDMLVTARRWDDDPPARTNFYDDIDGRDNLHEVHLVDRADRSEAGCINCHYNIHSNQSASNTQYNINGVVTNSPPSGVHTHLVNFSPDIQPFGGRARPEWWLNTSTGERRCYLSCHGFDMEGFPYRPPEGDDNHTVP